MSNNDRQNDNKARTVIIPAITNHPSIPNIINFLSGTSGGNGLHDFGQS